MVSLGILTALFVITRRAKRLKLDVKIISDAALWILVGALIGARLVTVLFYDPSIYFENPLEIFAIWHGGLSSVGGFIGAVVVGLWYFRRKQVDVWKYADATIFGLPIGLGIGRIGCFLIHDHPGTASDFVLAVQYPDGEARLDHGLLLSINGFLMALVFAILARKKRPVGMYLVVFGIWYGAVRFYLDFYRIIDATYLGLTPAQYVSVVMFVAGMWGAWRLFHKSRAKERLSTEKKT